VSVSLALQEAAIAALAADAPLRALIGDPARVFDYAPRGTAYPYLTVQIAAETDWSVSGSEGLEHRLTIQCWSRYAGRSETARVLARVRAVLHDASLTVAGARLVNLRCENVELGRAGGGAFQGVARFRAVTETV
jgi:hypothetical protein